MSVASFLAVSRRLSMTNLGHYRHSCSLVFQICIPISTDPHLRPLLGRLSVFSFPLKFSAQDTGQLFHSQCWNSKLPTHPGKPRWELMKIIHLRSSSRVTCRYSAPNTAMTSSTNLIKLSRAEVRDILQISSISS